MRLNFGTGRCLGVERQIKTGNADFMHDYLEIQNLV